LRCYFCPIFLNIEQSLGIIDYSLSQSTLEQVFLSFAAMQKNADSGAALGHNAPAAASGFPWTAVITDPLP
jgi:hypothetical protein